MQELENLGCLKGGKLIDSRWPGYLDHDRVSNRVWCAQHGLDFEIRHSSGHAGVLPLVEPDRGVAAIRVIPLHTDLPGRLGELIAGAKPVHDQEWVEVEGRLIDFPIRFSGS